MCSLWKLSNIQKNKLCNNAGNIDSLKKNFKGLVDAYLKHFHSIILGNLKKIPTSSQSFKKRFSSGHPEVHFCESNLEELNEQISHQKTGEET